MAMKVLVVDDSSNVRRQVSLALEGAGYEVVEATDGADGLAKVQSTADLGMVICDVNMPRMSGIEMIEALNPQVRKEVQIIMLTAEGQSALVKRAAAAGAKAWIVKPFKPELLVAAINKLAGLRAQRS